MDPKFIASPDWNNIGLLIRLLWALLLSIVVFGGAFLTAHVFLPSLLPPERRRQLRGARLFLYSLSGIAFVGAAFAAAQTLGRLTSILHFYPRFWI